MDVTKFDDDTIYGMMKISGSMRIAGCFGGSDSSMSWSDAFEGTPFYGQALTLEAQRLRSQAQIDQLDQQQSQGYDQIRAMRTQLANQEDELKAQMLEWKAQQMQPPIPDAAMAPGMNPMAPGVPQLQPGEEQMAQQAQQIADQQAMQQPQQPLPPLG